MFKNIKSIKGFTLAELLIVVAIIAVLVGISIPVFTTQLEKARDASSLANLRSAYAEASVAYMTKEGSSNIEVIDNSEGPIPTVVVIVRGVELKGKVSDKFSNNIESLPFVIVHDYDAFGVEPDPGTYSIIFNFDNPDGFNDEYGKLVAYLYTEE